MKERYYTLEQIGRMMQVSPDQIKRFIVLQGLEAFIPEKPAESSRFPQRVRESELLKHFNCQSMEEFRALRYRG